MNRSICAKGRGYVPSSSTGFCVAITKNGAGSAYGTPSTVTFPSSIASNKLDCVRGLARLISSHNKIFAKIGPGRKTKSCRSWLNVVTPVTSDGNKSAVNCTRLKSDRKSTRLNSSHSHISYAVFCLKKKKKKKYKNKHN